ncbi:MAG: Rieske (2Fe-2S) protein [Burkholderiales bacterium]|nr:Rieske 2Fe-2S domain-containing protein [Burkholderiales bacterium]MDQ3195873.1 Rieske 2Fe-2S domain-containing protein [Pseudomonadota bacterium]
MREPLMRERLICASADLANGVDGVRFAVTDNRDSAFVIRFSGRVHAYINRCAHQSVEPDWEPGKFFDQSGLYSICASHGAMYEPDRGRCVLGPCKGAGLEKLRVAERDNRVYWIAAVDSDPDGDPGRNS